MSFAIELMNRQPRTIGPEASVRQAARLLLDLGLDGLCVVEDGRLIGVVTIMDVIFQERRVELPSYVRLLNRLVPLQRDRQAILEKATGSTVREIMSPDPVGVTPDTPLEELAALMVDQHISMLPVVDRGALVGVIYKRDVLEEALRHMGGEER